MSSYGNEDNSGNADVDPNDATKKSDNIVESNDLFYNYDEPEEDDSDVLGPTTIQSSRKSETHRAGAP